MLPDNTNQTPYAFAKLEEAARVVKQAITELPAWRKRVEKHKDNKPKARECYNDLQNQYSRLLGALDSAALSLMEMEMPDVAEHSVKLGRSIKSFNLLTPDYTKLCAILSEYLDRLPISKTTNAHIIGRLMNLVKWGIIPQKPKTSSTWFAA